MFVQNFQNTRQGCYFRANFIINENYKKKHKHLINDDQISSNRYRNFITISDPSNEIKRHREEERLLTRGTNYYFIGIIIKGNVYSEDRLQSH